MVPVSKEEAPSHVSAHQATLDSSAKTKWAAIDFMLQLIQSITLEAEEQAMDAVKCVQSPTATTSSVTA